MNELKKKKKKKKKKRILHFSIYTNLLHNFL